MTPVTPKLIEHMTVPIDVERYRWPNGLTLIYHYQPDAPLLSYQTWVKVGSADEQKNKTGLAHLFEHLMFKGTERFPEGELDRILEGVGAEVNAATWLDWTYYYADLPSECLEVIAELEADRLANLSLDEERLEAERLVVMNERRECVDDDPSGRLDEILWFHGVGEGHPYAHPTIGWMKDIEQLSLTTCQAFYHEYYSPAQTTLVICGAVEREQLLAVIDRFYGELESAPPPPSLRFPEIQPVAQAKHELFLPLHAQRVQLGFQVPAIDDPLHLALECLDELLFEGISAPLYHRLVYEQEYASAVYSAFPQFRGDALYEMEFELHEGITPSQVLDVVLNELTQIAQGQLNPEEMNRAKRCKELNALRSMQTLQQRALTLGFWSVTTGKMDMSFKRQEKLRHISLEDLSRAAQWLLEPSRRIMVIGTPTESMAN